jgi:hypothetical protein
MVISGVKRKFPASIILALFAGLTALLSWSGFIPAHWVEAVYARHLFPTISHIAGYFADAVPFSWLDLWILISAYVLVSSVRRRNWRLPLALASAGYLIFFWGWGLNYHRSPLEARLGFKGLPSPTQDEQRRFTLDTANTMNELWPVVTQNAPGIEKPSAIARRASDRVRYVLDRIDGTNWSAATRVKDSYLADWWFRIAGIEGVFNPFGHEPVVVGGVADFELPFLMAHELAHVHGIADEGDANFVAYLACAESSDPEFQYSAAFEMWLHLNGPVQLLDAGPRRDLQTYLSQLLSQQLPQAASIQTTILDSHLKANGIHEGIASYSRFVALAIATRNRWPDFQ